MAKVYKKYYETKLIVMQRSLSLVYGADLFFKVGGRVEL